MADKSVNISLDANGVPQVDKSSVRLSRSAKNQVLWQNNSSQALTLAFVTSPFNSSSYNIAANASRGSGPASGGNDTYKYSITVNSTGKKLDPEVVVEN